jgi:hypothetical protein
VNWNISLVWLVWSGLGQQPMNDELQRSVGEFRLGDGPLRRAVQICLCTQNLLKDLRRQLHCLFIAVGWRYRLCPADAGGALFAGTSVKCSAPFSKVRAALHFCGHWFEGNTGDHQAPLLLGLVIALFQSIALSTVVAR